VRGHEIVWTTPIRTVSMERAGTPREALKEIQHRMPVGMGVLPGGK